MLFAHKTLYRLRNFRSSLAKLRVRYNFPINRQLAHEKIGTTYGGWYVPIRLLNEHSVCYCFGAGNDISFDVGLIRRFNCDVFTFDPTPQAIQHVKQLIANTNQGIPTEIRDIPGDHYQVTAPQLQKLHFADYGIWNANEILKFFVPADPRHISHSILNMQKTENYFEAQCYTLQYIMTQLNHTAVTLIKIDIEGAEYAVIDSMIASQIRPQIFAVEFDEGLSEKSGAIGRIRQVLGKLKKYGYQITYIHEWNYTFVDANLL